MSKELLEALKIAIKTELDGYYFYLMAAETIGLHVHPRSESRMRGDKGSNMKRLTRLSDKKTFVIIRDDQVDPDDVKVVKLK